MYTEKQYISYINGGKGIQGQGAISGESFHARGDSLKSPKMAENITRQGG